MDEYLVRTAKALEIARMRSGLSQQKLAARMGVNRGTIANWEQGLAAISLPMAMRWFTCCGVSVARYMGTLAFIRGYLNTLRTAFPIWRNGGFS